MKTYVIPASGLVAGCRRITRTRNEIISSSGTTYTDWVSNFSNDIKPNSNVIKYEKSSSRTIKGSSSSGAVYENKEVIDFYRIDLTFDISGVPSNRIQSVALRSKLTDKNNNTPRGYMISSVGQEGGIFDTNRPHFYPVTELGNCSLGSIDNMPYVHDAVLDGLSDTGWYTLWNESSTGYNYNESLTFDLASFYLVIITDEESAEEYTVSYDKGLYGTGTNTTDTKTAGAALILQDAIFERAGYTQTGWSVNSDGSTKNYDLGGNYTTDANITLYPYWTVGDKEDSALYIMTETGLKPIGNGYNGSESLGNAILDVSRFTPNSEKLSSQNIANAITDALKVGSRIYIPKGTYDFNVVIEKDCQIFIDSEAVLSTSNISACIRINNCSVQIEGGTFYAGLDDFDEENWDRSYIYGSGDRHGIIELVNAHDCIIRNITSTHSKFASVVYLLDCSNVIIENCNFSKTLLCGIQVFKYNRNITVRNCSFVKMRYHGTSYYCYAICTSMPLNTNDYQTPPAVIATPPDGLVVENCYVEDSEDSAIDTHGATNVIFRNNVIKNTVCAITAYNDSRRSTRPDGWTMRNVLIENNICDSSRSQAEGSTWNHPFFLLGNVNVTPASVSGYEQRAGSYEGFQNLVVRNNFIRQSGGNTLISLNTSSKNVVIENNVLDAGGVGAFFDLGHCMNFKIINNTGKNVAEVVIADHCYGEWKDNINISIKIETDKGISYVNGMDEASFTIRYPVSVKFGDMFYDDGDTKLCTSFGLRAIEDRIPDAYKSFTVNVTGNVCEVNSAVFVIPYLALVINGKTYYVRHLIDSRHFSIYKGSNTLNDGQYTCSVRFADLLTL